MASEQFLSLSIETPRSLTPPPQKPSPQSMGSVHQSLNKSSLNKMNDFRNDERRVSDQNCPLLHEISENNMKLALRLLSENDNTNLMVIKDELSKSLLHHSAANNNSYLFQMMINYQTKYLKDRKKEVGENILNWLNMKDRDGYLCTHHAALSGNQTIIDIYVKYGGKLQQSGTTLYHIAAQTNQYAFMVYLNAIHKIDYKIVDHRSSSVLHQSSFFGSEHCIDFLISWGVDVNLQDCDGVTPLHLAIIEGRYNIVKKFLWKGANVGITNNQGQNAVQIAREYSQLKILSLLKKSVRYQCRLGSASYQNDRSQLKLIVFSFILIVVILGHFAFISPFQMLWQMYLFISIFCILIVFFILTLKFDPGYVIQSKPNMSMYELVQLYQIQELCIYCGIIKPLRSKHCEICRSCVHLYDHHCPWINNCVGANNLNVFYVYILAQELAFIETILSSISTFVYGDQVNEIFLKFQFIIDFTQLEQYRTLQICILSIINVFALFLIIPLTQLVVATTKNIFQGVTTYERLQNQNKIYSYSVSNCQEMCQNKNKQQRLLME